MADYVEIFGGKLDWALPFQRTNAFPLDRASMFSSKSDADKYAAGKSTDPDTRGLYGTSYVGQIITVVSNNTVKVYKIAADRTLAEIGEYTEGDNKSIVLSGSTLKLYGFNSATEGQHVRIKNYGTELEPDLRLEWYTPDNSDVEALAERLDVLEGDDETVGSVDYKIAQFNTDVLEANYYNKDQVDSKLTGALHYKGTKSSLGALLTDMGSAAPSTGDVYNITNAGGYGSDGQKIKAGDNVIFNGTGDGTNYVAASGTKYYSDAALTTEVGTLATDTDATFVTANYSSVEVSETTYYVATSACRAPGWDVSAGTTDLTDYYTKSQVDALLNGKVDKVEGEGLLPTTERTRLASLEAISDATSGDGIITLTDKDGETRNITVYTLPTATTSVIGGIKSTEASTANDNKVTVANDGTASVDNIAADSIDGVVAEAAKVSHTITIGSKEFDGSADVEILASDVPIPDTYVEFSDIATTSTAGVVKSSTAQDDVSVNGTTGVMTVNNISASKIQGSVSSAEKVDHTLTIGSKTFDGSENIEILASDIPVPDTYVQFTDIAAADKAGVVKSSTAKDEIAVNSSTGIMSINTISGSKVDGTVASATDSTKLGGVAASDILVSDNGDLTSQVKSAAAADKLTTARTIAASGDATWSVSFDGSANASATLTLAEVLTPAAGTYTKVTVNKKGLVTDATTLDATDIPTLTLSKISDAGTLAGKNEVARTDISSAFETDIAALETNSHTHTNKATLDDFASDDLTHLRNMWTSHTDWATWGTTISHYGITDAYTKTEIDEKIGGAFHYKGSYTNYPALVNAVKNPEVGDVYNIATADGSTDSKGTLIKAGDNVACSAKNSIPAGKKYYSDTTLETEVDELAATATVTYVNANYSEIVIGTTTYYVATSDTVGPQWDVLAGTTDLSAYKTWVDTKEVIDTKADQTDLDAVDQRLGAVETTVGDSDDGLVKDVADLQSNMTAAQNDIADLEDDLGHASDSTAQPAVAATGLHADVEANTAAINTLNADAQTTGSVRQLIAASASDIQNSIDAITEVGTGTIDTRIAAHNTDSSAHADLFAAKQNKVTQTTVTLAAASFSAASSGAPAPYSATFNVNGLESAKNYKLDLVPQVTAANMDTFLAAGFLPQVICDAGQMTVYAMNEPSADFVVVVTATEIQASAQNNTPVQPEPEEP